ncbi:MAG TPA: type II toxin-antitoxin system mRNA interferase toxin, RelE/StbE family, partial [Gammaproteobacteria bacterium]|nr:type II toxin-antitoxin system mRNA interferase toxin, RelE/StbE family [Gammaproteobacteria bacterium]
KLRRSGFRLIYRVEDEVLFISVIAVGKRERSAVYKKAEERQ